MRRPDASGLVGILLLILVIVAATAAIILYKRYDIQTVLIYSVIGVAVVFLIGILFTGIKLPSPKQPTRLAIIYVIVITMLIEVAPYLDETIVL